MSDIPESDRLGDFRRPRETADLVGHETAEKHVLDVLRSGKVHHAWLLQGPKGIGKATFAYRFARFIFRYGGHVPEACQDLGIPQHDLVFSRVAAMGHADLLTLRRPYDEKTKKLKRDVTVDEVRKLTPFFGLKAGEGGWRVAIVDTADDMNVSAANALLKILEEPPERSLIILVSNAPARLLPTIRSRCRALNLKPLSPENIQTLAREHLNEMEIGISDEDLASVARMSGGSLSRALDLTGNDGLDLYRRLLGVFREMPQLNMAKVNEITSQLKGKKAEANWPLFQGLLSDFYSRLATGAALHRLEVEYTPGEGETLTRLMQMAQGDQWIDQWDQTRQLMDQATSLNLDKGHTALDCFFQMQALVQNRN